MLVITIKQLSKSAWEILHRLSTFWGLSAEHIFDRNEAKTNMQRNNCAQTRQLCSTPMCISQLNSLRVERLITPCCSPPSAIPTHTHTHIPAIHTLTHTYTQSGNSVENSPHLLLPHSLVSSLRFNDCATKARLPPPMSHNYLLTAQTNRANQRVTSNQNCHRWLSPVIKSARPLPVRRVREWKEEGECDSTLIIEP